MNEAQATQYDTPPAIAAAIRGWFPELGNRSFAVTEIEITKDNVPTLPLAMVAFKSERAQQQPRGNGDIKVVESLIVQFWFKVERYKRADGSESPFWAYYSFEQLRNKLLGHLHDWRSPRGFRILYAGGDIDADQLAVQVTFQFDHEFEWCIERHDPAPPEPCNTVQLSLDIGPVDHPLPDPDCPAPTDTTPQYPGSHPVP